MSRHAQENIVSIVLLLVFIGVIVLCQDFGPRARMIPLPLAVFGIVLTVIQMAWHNLGSPDELKMDLISIQAREAAAADSVQASERKSPVQREAVAYGIIGLLVAIIFLVGLMPAVFLFSAGYLWLSRYASWLRSLVYSSLLTLAVYLLFEVALQMQPYHGLLAPLYY